MTRTAPLVSVILPTYGRPELFNRAISSALNQSYENLELIIIDDSRSSDEKLDVPISDDRVAVLVNKGNEGVSYSRNRGIQEADGKYVAFLDDDDCWHEEKIYKQVDIIESSSEEYCGVYTGAQCIRQGEVVRTIDQPIDGNIYPKILENFFLYPTTSFLLLREAIEDVGGFDESMDRGEDWDLTIRLAQRYKFLSINEQLTTIGYHEDNISWDNEHGLISMKNIWQKYEPEFDQYPQVRREFLHNWRHQKAIQEITSGNRLNTLKYAVQNLRHPTAMDLGLLLIAPFGNTGYRMARQLVGPVSKPSRVRLW